MKLIHEISGFHTSSYSLASSGDAILQYETNPDTISPSNWRPVSTLLRSSIKAFSNHCPEESNAILPRSANEYYARLDSEGSGTGYSTAQQFHINSSF